MLSQTIIDSAVERALAEDLQGGEDVTSIATISSSQVITAEIRARKAGILAGIPLAVATFRKCGATDIQIMKNDGEQIASGECGLRISGSVRAILLAERTALNFLGHLSGIATYTARWVAAISETSAVIRDTRKTTPGLRALEKYAVRMGGGENHRMSLSSSALIKDNHIVAAGSISNAFSAIRSKYPNLEVEVEVDSLAQLSEAIDAGAKLILLDNMTPAKCREARRIAGSAVKLEASGGITLDTALSYAVTGIDYLAIGALTHSAPTLDLGLDFLESGRG